MESRSPRAQGKPEARAARDHAPVDALDRVGAPAHQVALGGARAQRGAGHVPGRSDLLLLLTVYDRADLDTGQATARAGTARRQRSQRPLALGQHRILLRRRPLHGSGVPVLVARPAQPVHVLEAIFGRALEGMVARRARAQIRRFGRRPQTAGSVLDMSWRSARPKAPSGLVLF